MTDAEKVEGWLDDVRIELACSSSEDSEYFGKCVEKLIEGWRIALVEDPSLIDVLAALVGER